MRNSALLPIFLIVLVDVLGLTIILPLLPFYAEHMGASATQVGLLFSSYAICQLISGPLLGSWSDRIGRRPLLLVSQAGTFAGFIVLAYAQTLWVVFLARIIDGFTAGNLSLAQAYISDVTKPEDRAKSFGLIGIAFGIGFLIGPAISGFLAQFSYQLPIFAAAGLSLSSIAATYFLLPERRPSESVRGAGRFPVWKLGGYARFFRQPALSPLLWQFFAFIFAFSTFMSGFALFAGRRYTWDGEPFGAKHVGYLFAYVGFLGIIIQGRMIGPLVRRYGEWKVTVTGFLVSIVGFGVLAISATLPSLLGVLALIAFGTGVLRPAITALITRTASESEQGTVLGLTQALTSVAQIFGPFLAGFLIDQHLLWLWALTAALCSLLGLLAARKRPSSTPGGLPVQPIVASPVKR